MENKINRRTFLAGVGAVVSYPLWGRVPVGETPLLRFGMVADCHHADKEDSWWNDITMYRRAKGRLEEAMKVFCERKPDFMIELGDFKDIQLRKKEDVKPGEDRRDKEATVRLLKDVEEIFGRFEGPRYHVFGNHDNDMLNKDEFNALCPNTGIPADRTYYSFEAKGVTFVVLDGNFTKDFQAYRGDKINWNWTESTVPPEELAWFKGVLASAPGKVVVFIHQRLDSMGREHHRVLNGEAVQKAMAASGKVIGVFQGHDHVGGFVREFGIDFYTLRALVAGPRPEYNSYAEAAVYPSGAIVVTGFRQAASAKMGV